MSSVVRPKFLMKLSFFTALALLVIAFALMLVALAQTQPLVVR